MVCSTSAKSSVRLINATSFNDSLQLRCMTVISKYSSLVEVKRNVFTEFIVYIKAVQSARIPNTYIYCFPTLQIVKKMPGFSLLCKELWFMLPKERYQYTTKCCKTVDEFDIIAAISDDTNEDDEKYFHPMNV